MSLLRVLLPAAAAALLGFGLYAGCALVPFGLGRPSVRDAGPAAEALWAERLDAQQQALARGCAVSEQIRCDLIEGRLTFRQAIAALAEEDARRPPQARSRFDLLPGRNDEERYGRATLICVENRLRDDPRRDAVVARLRAELDDLLAASGGRQPTAPSSSSLPGD